MTPLPDLVVEDERYDALRTQPEPLYAAVRHVLDHLNLPSAPFRLFADGGNFAFEVQDLVVKLYPPFLQHQFAAEKWCLPQLEARLFVQTPHMHGAGRLQNWGWVVMSKLSGETLESVWPALGSSERCAVLHHIGQIAQATHRLSFDGPPLDTDWGAFLKRQQQGCVDRQTSTGLPAHLIDQIPDYLRSVQDVLPRSPPMVLLTGEYTPFNLLGQVMDGRWRLTGMIDFGDAMFGDPQYDLLGPLCFLCEGRAPLVNAFLSGYGMEDRSQDLARTLTAYLLLHRYSHLDVQIRIEGWKERCSRLDQLEQLILPSDVRATSSR